MRFVSSSSSRSIPSQQRSRGILAFGVAFFAILMLAIFTAGPASAHNALTNTAPEDGAMLSEAPDEIILTFDDKVIEVGSLISVIGPDGDELVDGDVVIERNVVSQALVADLPAGEYEVLWRVTSADGHPIDGEFTFTAESTVSAEDPAEDATAEPSEEKTEEAEATEEATPAGEATPTDDVTSADTEADADDSDSDGMSTGLLIAIIVGAFILGFIVVLFVNRSRKSARESDNDASDIGDSDSGSGTED